MSDVTEYTIGVDIGGTKISVVLADGKGSLLRKVKEPTYASKGPQYVIGRITGMVKALMAQSNLSSGQISCLGYAF